MSQGSDTQNQGEEVVAGNSRPEMAVLLDAITECVFVSNQETMLFMNGAAKALFTDIDSEKPSDLSYFMGWVFPEDRSLLQQKLNDCLEGKSDGGSFEFRFLANSTEMRWFRGSVKPIVWAGHEAVVASLYDITDQKEVAHAHDRSEQLFQNIFRITPEVMLLSSLTDGRIYDVNPAFLNVFGYRRDDVIGRTSEALGIWADSTFLNRFVEELKMTVSMTNVPATVRTRGKMIRHFQLNAQKIDHAGEQLLLLIGRDVTDELIQAQELQRSKDSAELANRAKSEFLANMSHELRTPLNAILGFAEILRDQIIGPIGNDRYCEYAQDIHESGTHLLSIINDILDLSKVEAGRLEAYLHWIDPTNSLDMCMTLVQQRAFENDITLEKDMDETVELEADQRLIKQIGLNLLSNAVKFTQPGGHVKMCLSRTGNAGLCLSISDTGIGMTPDEIKIAKRPFGQVDTSLSKRHEGSGLGLPLVTAFTEKLQATMTIDSQPGVGTRVNILFPPEKVREKQKAYEEESLDQI